MDFHEKVMDEDAFGAKGSIVSAFDAFRKQAIPHALRACLDSCADC